jgi:anti-sigma regulatory factor (Ser/Thr protein kinase)
MSDCMIEKTASPENIECFGLFSEKALRQFKLPEEKLQELLMALDEAVTNISMHAYGDPKGSLKIVVSGDADEVSVELIDNGKAFDPTKFPEHDLNVPIEERQVGGMGVQLMKKLSDGMRYFRKDNQNHFILTKKTGFQNV